MNLLFLLFSVLTFAATERKISAEVVEYKATASGSSTPASGYERCYVKSDGFMWCKGSTGTEYRIQDSQQKNILLFDQAGTYTYEIKTATPSGNLVFMLPSDDGVADDVLTTNGNGFLRWASPSGSSGGGTKTFWNGYYDSTCTFQATGTYPTNGEFLDEASCSLVETYNNGMGTVSVYGSTKPGVTFTAPSNGYVETCMESNAIAGSSGAYWILELTDGTRSSAAEAGNTATVEIPWSMCVVTQVTATSSYTIKLLASISVGTLNVNGGGYSKVQIRIKYL